MSRSANRANREKRGITSDCLTVETLEVRLCMDAAGLLEDRQLLAPQAEVRLAALVAAPRVGAEVPRVKLSGPAIPVGRGADAVFNVSLSVAPGEGKTVSVRYSTFDGLARAGKQYVATGGLLEFTGNETTKAVYVPTIAGAQSFNPKADRFGLKLSGPAGVKLVSSTAYATIAPSVQGLGISSPTVVEGDSGTKTATFVVTLGRPVSKTVTVDYATVDGTATVENNDYISTHGSLTFAPGETRKTITVDVNGDTEREIDETFKVVLSNAKNVDLQLPVGVATIRTDDPLPEIVHAFQITLDYSTTINGPVPEPVRKAAEWAAKRWSEVIVGDLPDVNDPDLGLIDDFRMTVGMGLLDTLFTGNKPGGTLANATAIAFRRDGQRLPYLGIAGVDPADAQDPQLRNIMLHEFGHALGFGTLWIDKNLSLNAGPTNATTNPVYVGANAVREYNAAFQTSLTAIPIENMTAGVAGKYGDGSFGAHWRESVMGNEVMTSLSEYAGVPMPLSRITVAAMADLGYTVDYAAADPYTPSSRPPGLVMNAAAGITSGVYALQSPAFPAATGKSASTPAGMKSPLAEQESVAQIAAAAAASGLPFQSTRYSSNATTVPTTDRSVRVSAVTSAAFAFLGQFDLIAAKR